jgi:hypothetical protein
MARTPENSKPDPDLDPDTAFDLDDTDVDAPVALRGFVGKSSRGKDFVRIYPSLDRESFWEVERSDVVRRVRVGGDATALSGSVVFVKPTAEIITRVARTTRARADFLKGSINPAGAQAIGGLSVGNSAATTLICVTATIIITTTIIVPRGSANSGCCESNGCSATSQCLCSGGGQSGPTCNVC